MIDRFQLLRNVGQFDNVSPSPQLTLSRLSLIYGENGRGKTTLAAILRSLASGEPNLITERQRLGATHAPHVVIEANGQAHIFQNAWSATVPDIAIFDDEFVGQNVCSGIEIDAAHRQNLHELILGAQGVALNAALQRYVSSIEQHNRELRAKTEAIPASVRGTLSLDAFCALPANPDVDRLIEEAEHQLAAARAGDQVSRHPAFVPVSMPSFDVPEIHDLLGRQLANLQQDTANQVQAHLRKLGPGSGAWVSEGMQKIPVASEGVGHDVCPFCMQALQGSDIIRHYEAYFSKAYTDLQEAITAAINQLLVTHSGDVTSAFERWVRVAVQTQEFWSRFTAIPPVDLDTAAIYRVWDTARNAVMTALKRKESAPLEPITLSDEALATIERYNEVRASVHSMSDELQSHNAQIAVVKEQAATADATTLERDIGHLKATRARHTEPTASRCRAYIEERNAKVQTETLRDQARAALDDYRENIFPRYQESINQYLQRFNAGFRLARVGSVNTRAGSACQYNVVINNVEVSPTATAGPSFRNTLSAGDRNTLALAFFFASIDQDPGIASKIVVIDDPMTSLDEHRSLTTVQETRRLTTRVDQVIVLSHSKPFLCALWTDTDQTLRCAMIVTRQGDGSTIVSWDVNRDCVTAHDRRYDLVRQYLVAPAQVDERKVAEALRHMLEAFLRIGFSPDFPPGSMIGANFMPRARQRAGTAQEIVSQRDIDELQDILDYANRFHHDTNPAYETEAINDQELRQFASRTLRFISRK